METKAVNLTKEEVIAVIKQHSYQLDNENISERLERMNYLNKRLAAFSEPEIETKPATQEGWK